MAKCNKCGKWGLFLRLNNKGLCAECETIERSKPKTHFTINDVNELQRSRAQNYKIDLVAATCTGYHCAECSKYINRVYSQSGIDNRFPILPDYVKNHADHCRITLYPFVYGANIMRDVYTGKSINDKEIIKYSNRPYVDSRPPQWIEGYRKHQAKQNNNDNFKSEYKQICELLPDIAPKNQAGYTRMKKANSDSFKKLAESARQAGIIIHDIENEE